MTDYKMTYKHYILANGIKDSKEAYAEYREKHDPIYRAMPEAMKKQIVNGSYGYRFA